MAGQERNREGSAEEKRAAAREAKKQGKRPSEMSATTGAQRRTDRDRPMRLLDRRPEDER